MWQTLRTWYRERQLRRIYREMSPGEHAMALIRALNSSPELRAAFRKALRVKGMEELTAPKVRIR